MDIQYRFLWGLLLYCSMVTVKAQNFELATQIGGLGLDKGTDIFVDELGNSYITGVFADKVPFLGTDSIAAVGNNDLFISKLDKDGNVIWANALGGENIDEANAIVVDNEGNSYITGSIRDAVVVFGDSLKTSNFHDSDLFVAKYDNTGSLTWFEKLAGDGVSEGMAIALDNGNNVYVTGVFQDTLVHNTDTIIASNSTDMLLVKYTTTGELVWKRPIGGAKAEAATSIQTDMEGNVYIGGWFESTLVFGSQILVPTNGIDAFLAKFNEDGESIWAIPLGGANSESVMDIQVDEVGNLYAVGHFLGSITLGTTTLTVGDNGDINVFLAKYNTDGTLAWANQIDGQAVASAIDIDVDNNVYAMGNFYHEVTFGGDTLVDENEIFITKFSVEGNYVWGIKGDGESYTTNHAFGLDAEGTLYLTGGFIEEARFNEEVLVSNGNIDMFFAKLNQNLPVGGLMTDFGLDSKVKVYPNPADYQLIIDLPAQKEKVSVSLINLLGQVVYEQHELIGKKHNINLQSIQDGIYLLAIQSKEGIKTTRVLIKH